MILGFFLATSLRHLIWWVGAEGLVTFTWVRVARIAANKNVPS